MKVKLCAIQCEADIAAVVDSGADYAGFLVGQSHASNDFITVDKARSLVKMLPDHVTPILVTHFTEPRQIEELCSEARIRTIQLHGNCSPEQISELRRLKDGLFLIHVLHVGETALDAEYNRYSDVVDAFLLDSADLSRDMVGGTGLTHDWAKSADFVRRSAKPVFLAGGLHANNVGDAVTAVRPFAVDVNSGVKGIDGKRDAVRCLAFVQNARQSSLSA